MELTKQDRDCYRTPRYLVEWIKNNFHTNIDGCASSENKTHPFYIGLDHGNTKFSNFLFVKHEELEELLNCNQPRLFINPPYSNPMPFVKKTIELMKKDVFIVLLLPADKSTKWFEEIAENATEIIDIVGGRVNFLNPITGEEVKGNNKGSLIAVFNPFMQGTVTRTVSLKFIKECGKC